MRQRPSPERRFRDKSLGGRRVRRAGHTITSGSIHGEENGETRDIKNENLRKANACPTWRGGLAGARACFSRRTLCRRTCKIFFIITRGREGKAAANDSKAGRLPSPVYKRGNRGPEQGRDVCRMTERTSSQQDTVSSDPRHVFLPLSGFSDLIAWTVNRYD